MHPLFPDIFRQYQLAKQKSKQLIDRMKQVTEPSTEFKAKFTEEMIAIFNLCKSAITVLKMIQEENPDVEQYTMLIQLYAKLLKKITPIYEIINFLC